MFNGIKLKNILFILVGAAIFSFGLVHYNIQNELAEGGFTGITLHSSLRFQLGSSTNELNFKYPDVYHRMEVIRQTRFYLYGNWNSRCFYIHQNIYDLPI